VNTAGVRPQKKKPPRANRLDDVTRHEIFDASLNTQVPHTLFLSYFKLIAQKRSISVFPYQKCQK